MFIDASVNGQRVPEMEQEAANKAIDFLTQVALMRKELSSPALLIDQEPLSSVVAEMWKACRLMRSPDLTPMAAVAGSIADATASFLSDLGATKVIVNNGGDIALRMSEEGSITIGLRSDVTSKTVNHKLLIYGTDHIGGVCTSGLGGRSLTRGIASAAVVLASKCSVADAAATYIANHTCIESSKIKKVLAEDLDPDSDIRDLEVTVGFDRLTEDEIATSVSNGLMRAEELTANGLIIGTFLQVSDQFRTSGGIMARLEPVQKVD